MTLVAVREDWRCSSSGYTMGRQAGAEPGTAADDAAFQPFWDTYHAISDRYAGGDVNRDGPVQGAIKGMIDSLGDLFSQYLSSTQYRRACGISGQFEGIGAEIATSDPGGSEAARRSVPPGWSSPADCGIARGASGADAGRRRAVG